MREKILLHTCCAPCVSYVHELLKKEYDITLFYYNPNISPLAEYEKRLNELVSFTEQNNILLSIGEYHLKEWMAVVRQYKYNGERSERCFACYRFRLEQSFKKALELNIEAVATVLSISPHKDAVMLNSIGKELAAKYRMTFLISDFKKNDGFKKSTELSKAYGFYRQNYCGCVFSKLEREKNPRWIQKIIEHKPRVTCDSLQSHAFQSSKRV